MTTVVHRSDSIAASKDQSTLPKNYIKRVYDEYRGYIEELISTERVVSYLGIVIFTNYNIQQTDKVCQKTFGYQIGEVAARLGEDPVRIGYLLNILRDNTLANLTRPGTVVSVTRLVRIQRDGGKLYCRKSRVLPNGVQCRIYAGLNTHAR